MEIKRYLVSAASLFAFVAAAVAPAAAFWPVIDPTAIAQITKEVAQAQQMVQQAKSLVGSANTNLLPLASGTLLTNIQGRISTVNGLLQQARTACQGAMLGKVQPSVCQVQLNTANVQQAQLESEMMQLQSLQASAKTTPGGLAAQQLNTESLVELATQMQELRQAETAAVLQKGIDAQSTMNALHGTTVVNPWQT